MAQVLQVMANTLSAAVTLNATINGVQMIQNQTDSSTVPVANQQIQNIQTIGTATEAVSLIDTATGGYVLLKNLNSTNFIEISDDNATAHPLIKLRAGQVALFPTEAAAIYAKADTAACNMLVMAVSL